MADDKTYLALADEHQWKSYNDLSQIGITAGSETIMDIVVAMPVASELSYAIRASQHNHDAYPYPTGTITIKKYSDSACDIEHVCSANNEYRGTWRMYAVGSSNTWILSEWVQVYDSVNPPTEVSVESITPFTVDNAEEGSTQSFINFSMGGSVNGGIGFYGLTPYIMDDEGNLVGEIIHSENLPTAEDLGALPTAGGTMTGNIQFDKAAGENGYGEVYKYHSDWLDYGMRVKDVTADGAQAILIARASKQAIQAELTPAGGSATVYYIPLCTQDMKFSVNDDGTLKITY